MTGKLKPDLPAGWQDEYDRTREAEYEFHKRLTQRGYQSTPRNAVDIVRVEELADGRQAVARSSETQGLDDSSETPENVRYEQVNIREHIASMVLREIAAVYGQDIAAHCKHQVLPTIGTTSDVRV